LKPWTVALVVALLGPLDILVGSTVPPWGVGRDPLFLALATRVSTITAALYLAAYKLWTRHTALL